MRIFGIVMAALLASSCGKADKSALMLDASAFDTTVNGKQIALYTLSNDNGMSVQLTNYGARIASLIVPDAKGEMKDVVLGHPSIKAYLEASDKFCGPIVGRYGNRIGAGEFQLDGKAYKLTLNNNGNQLHGGPNGWFNRVWDVQTTESLPQSITMTYLSPDGEEGYPGNVSIAVTYTLTDDNALELSYKATTDSATVINPTSHCYFNLHGTPLISTNSHILTINADSYTPTNASLIPTGEVSAVEGTPLDFRVATAIGDRADEDFEALRFGKGYDHNWVLNPDSVNTMTFAAEVYEPSTGIVMRVETDQPALQFYSGNFFNGSTKGKRDEAHNYRGGIALETQNYPDAPNHPNFPNSVLRPDEVYTHRAVYRFSIQQ